MNIVLVGFMGSGKSRVGRMLAKRIQWNHIDTDDLIVKDQKMSIPEIIKKFGEPYFRDVEKKIIEQVAKQDQTVISTGGGVPLDENNMKALAQTGELVWLQVSPEMVLKRIGDLKTRPLIDTVHPLESIKTKMAEREPFYSQARHQVNTAASESAQVVETIISLLHLTP